jgi:HEAT repeat protein
MRVGTGCRSLGLAIVLLSVGCRGKAHVAYKELVDDDPAVRADAASRLGQARAKDAVASLAAVMNDPDEAVRVNVLRALGEIGDTSMIDRISPMVGDPVSTVRMAACQALGMLNDPRGVPALEKALSDENQTVRIVAARALGTIPGPASLEVLVRVALQDESEVIRSHVMKVIGERKSKDAVPRLESALLAESDSVRANAARALELTGDRSSLPALIRALDDPFFKVRSLSAHAIAAVANGDEAGKAALAKRLAVEDVPMVRVDLAWSLGLMGDRSQVDVVRTLLFKGQPEDVRAEAAIALGEVGDQSDLPRLEKAMDDKKGLVRSRAADAVDKLKGIKTGTTS